MKIYLKDISRFSPPQISIPSSYDPTYKKIDFTRCGSRDGEGVPKAAYGGKGGPHPLENWGDVPLPGKIRRARREKSPSGPLILIFKRRRHFFT